MKMRFPILVLVTFAAGSGLVWSDRPGYALEHLESTSTPFWPRSTANFPQSGCGGGGGWGWGYRHASTYEEGVLRGMAALWKADGARNLLNSQALGNIEDARRKNIDNWLFRTHTYFKIREYNRQARAAARGPRATKEDLEKYARWRAPRRLSASEVNPMTGTIAWPINLRDAQYRRNRETLDRLYGSRAKSGYLTSEQQAQALQAVEAMDADLKKNIRAYAPMNYLTLKSFVAGLKYDLVVPATPTSNLVSVAQR